MTSAEERLVMGSAFFFFWGGGGGYMIVTPKKLETGLRTISAGILHK